MINIIILASWQIAILFQTFYNLYCSLMSGLMELYTTIITLRDKLAYSVIEELSSEELAMVQQQVREDFQYIYMMGERSAIVNEETKEYVMNATLQEQLSLNIMGQQAYEALIQMGKVFPTPDIEREHQQFEERLRKLKEDEERLWDLIVQKQLLEELELADRENREVEQELAKILKNIADNFQRLHMTEGPVRVICRIRPFKNPNEEEIVQWESFVKIKYRKSRPNVTEPSKEDIHDWFPCSLDFVIPKEIGQRDVFTQVQYLVHAVMRKGKSLILTIGHSGSGSTHTMIGPKQSLLEPESEQAGIVPRAIHLAFLLAEKEGKRISIQYRQYYDKDAKKSRPRSSQPRVSVNPRSLSYVKSKGPIEVTKRMKEEITWPSSVEQALCTLKVKMSERKTAKTQMNDSSSRSHLLICLRINQGKEVQGMISFLDLAGELRVQPGNPAQETSFINSSISEMTQILRAIRDDGYYSYASHPVFVKHLRPYLQVNKILAIVTLSSKKQDEEFNSTSIAFAHDLRREK